MTKKYGWWSSEKKNDTWLRQPSEISYLRFRMQVPFLDQGTEITRSAAFSRAVSKYRKSGSNDYTILRDQAAPSFCKTSKERTHHQSFL